MPLAIKKIIRELGNSDQELRNTRLVELSNLGSEELECWKSSWAAIETKRRQQIVNRLVELAEDNLELNFDSVLKHCLKDPDDEVRSKAIEGLWENEEAPLISLFINRLEQDSSEKVQVAAATALGKFALLAEHQKLRDCHITSLQEALLTALNDTKRSIEVRRRALEAAAPLSLPQVKASIRDAYQSGDPKLRVSAIYAMGKNCDTGWLPILIKELSSRNTEVRYEAAGACGELEEEAAVPYLIRLGQDPDIDIQMAAIQSLGKIGGAQAKEYLGECLDSDSNAIRQAAEQALSDVESRDTSLPFSL